jgi:hypothetical protein
MKRKSLPIGILVVAMMVALGGLGVVYGAWSQDIAVPANVYTATFGVTLTPGAASGPCTAAPGGDYPGSALTVNMLAAKPGDVCTVPVTLKNTGSIPANLSYTPFSMAGVNWLDVSYPFSDAVLQAGTNNSVSGNLVLTVKSDSNQPNPAGEDGFSGVWFVLAAQ